MATSTFLHNGIRYQLIERPVGGVVKLRYGREVFTQHFPVPSIPDARAAATALAEEYAALRESLRENVLRGDWV